MDKKTHYNEILDEMKLILDKYEHHRDHPNDFIERAGKKLGQFEEPKVITAYDKLIMVLTQFSHKAESQKIRD